MADKKISQLTALSAANLAPSTDVLAIVDTSATETKKIVAQDLINGVLNVASAVGIGTTSPAVKLHVQGSAGQIMRVTDGTTGASIYSGGGLFGFNNQTGEDGMFGSTASHFLYFATNGGASTTTVATMTAAGNMGLGVTPSAWSGRTAIQLPDSAYVVSSGPSVLLGANVYFNGVNRTYISNGVATDYRQINGEHRWEYAASGTINTAISFTQAMTLDASSNLIVGTTVNHPSARIFASGAINSNYDSTIALRYNVSGQTNNYYKGMTGTSIESALARGLHIFNYDADGNPGINFYPNSYAGQIASASMTLDPSGNLGIGTSSPVSALHIQRGASAAAYYAAAANNATLATSGFLIGQDAAGLSRIYQYGSNPMTFWINDTERGRFTAGGYFKASDAGTYLNSTSNYHELRSSNNSATVVITNTNGSYTDDLIYGNTSTAAGTGFKLIRLDSNSVEQFRVRGDGTIFAQNTTVQSLSDLRLKENISDANDGLSVITALRPVRYDWKTGYGNNRKNQLGFIAQEVETVFPDAVSVWEIDEPTGEVAEDGEPITEKVDYKTVGPGALIPVLVKAMQEQQAMIETLKAKVAALEAK
jgi:hypothetical protein